MSADLLSRRTSTPFLGLDLPGTKVLVGDGPEWAALQARFPEAVFLGSRVGEDLAAIYASSDVFVFPSRTDTYGIVLLEALASGLPVAAYPVPGPSDVVGRHNVGILDQDLRSAALNTLAVPRSNCRAVVLVHSWTKSAEVFLANIVPLVGRQDESVLRCQVRPEPSRPSPYVQPNRCANKAELSLVRDVEWVEV
jgi:hypothetical protein